MHQSGETPLFAAAENGHTESISMLLQARAAVDAKAEVRGALFSFMSRALALLLSFSSLALFLGFISKYTRICREQAVRSSDYWTVY